MGTLAIINALLTIVTTLSVFGTDISILKIVPEHFTKYSLHSAVRVYRKIHYFVITLSLISGLILFCLSSIIASKIFFKPHLYIYFMLTSFFIVFKAITTLNTQAMRGFQLARSYALMLIIPQALNFLFLIALGLIVANMDVPIYAHLVAYAFTGVASLFLLENFFKAPYQKNEQIHNVSVYDIASISLPMLMTTMMMLVIAQTGVIMLGMLRTETEVGYYTIAARLSTMTAYIIYAVNSMAGPKFSELFHSGEIDDLFYVAKKSTKLIFLTTFPILLCFILFGKPLLRVVFGDEFVAAYTSLLILSIGQFIHAISGATALFMNMTGSQKALRNIMAFATFFNIVLNLILIPKNGIAGAAISASFCLIILNLASLTFIKLKFGKTIGYFPWITKLRL